MTLRTESFGARAHHLWRQRLSPSRPGAGHERPRERLIHLGLFLAAALSLLVTVGIVAVLIFETIEFFRAVSLLDFFGSTTWAPLFLQQSFGVWPLVVGTLMISIIALAVAVPLGLLAAILLSEYAPPRARALLKPTLEMLAGIPTVVYGYFALLFVSPIVQAIFPGTGVFNALSTGVVMGIMILPTISSLSEDAFAAVPRSLREASYAMGANAPWKRPREWCCRRRSPA